MRLVHERILGGVCPKVIAMDDNLHASIELTLSMEERTCAKIREEYSCRKERVLCLRGLLDP